MNIKVINEIFYITYFGTESLKSSLNFTLAVHLRLHQPHFKYLVGICG